MITVEQMLEFKERLKIAWKDILPDARSITVWADSFRDYDYATVETAIIEYMRTNRFKPNPADIISCIPAAQAEPKQKAVFVPKYETMPDGKLVRVIKCRRCRDTGLFTWENEKHEVYGRPCECQAAIAFYGTCGSDLKNEAK